MTAAINASSSAYEVSIRHTIWGCLDRISRQTSIPLPSGSRTSRMATSGRGRWDAGKGLLDRARLADHLDVLGGLEERPKTGSNDLVIVEQEYSHRAIVPAPVVDRRPWPAKCTEISMGVVSGTVPYRSIVDPAKLRRLLEATLLIESDLELPDVLRHVVEEACAMTGARYGALGVLDEDGSSLSKFITVGLWPEQEAAIGPRPKGRGVLGLFISDPQTILIPRDRPAPAELRLPAQSSAHDLVPGRTDQGAGRGLRQSLLDGQGRMVRIHRRRRCPRRGALGCRRNRHRERTPPRPGPPRSRLRGPGPPRARPARHCDPAYLRRGAEVAGNFSTGARRSCRPDRQHGDRA